MSMQSKATQLLFDEHEVISSIASVIAQIDKTWEKDAANYTSSVNGLLRFLKEYSDGYHHQKEEEILFPHMLAKNEMLDGIIDELIEHHEDFRGHVQRIEQELEAGNFASVQQKLAEYLDGLLDHIAIENDELFQMAETLFMENELDDIYFRMLDKDRELGEEAKRQLEATIKELCATIESNTSVS